VPVATGAIVLRVLPDRVAQKEATARQAQGADLRLRYADHDEGERLNRRRCRVGGGEGRHDLRDRRATGTDVVAEREVSYARLDLPAERDQLPHPNFCGTFVPVRVDLVRGERGEFSSAVRGLAVRRQRNFADGATLSPVRFRELGALCRTAKKGRAFDHLLPYLAPRRRSQARFQLELPHGASGRQTGKTLSLQGGTSRGGQVIRQNTARTGERRSACAVGADPARGEVMAGIRVFSASSREDTVTPIDRYFLIAIFTPSAASLSFRPRVVETILITTPF